MTDSGLLQRRQDLIGQATLFYKSPVHLARGEGVAAVTGRFSQLKHADAFLEAFAEVLGEIR